LKDLFGPAMEKFRRIKQEMKAAQNNLFLRESMAEGSGFGTTERVILSKANIADSF